VRRHTVLLALAALLVAGCSALKLGYTQADIILGWRANSYFDLDADQRREFSTRLDQLLAWHRHEQLPDYAQFLTVAIDKAEHGLNRGHRVARRRLSRAVSHHRQPRRRRCSGNSRDTRAGTAGRIAETIRQRQ
jgi:hypothetical protein